jgi:hypothetical protein
MVQLAFALQRWIPGFFAETRSPVTQQNGTEGLRHEGYSCDKDDPDEYEQNSIDPAPSDSLAYEPSDERSNARAHEDGCGEHLSRGG